MSALSVAFFWLVVGGLALLAVMALFAINPRRPEDDEEEAAALGDPVNYDADRTPSWRKM